jgi:hypothetical protein
MRNDIGHIYVEFLVGIMRPILDIDPTHDCNETRPFT